MRLAVDCGQSVHFERCCQSKYQLRRGPHPGRKCFIWGWIWRPGPGVIIIYDNTIRANNDMSVSGAGTTGGGTITLLLMLEPSAQTAS